MMFLIDYERKLKTALARIKAFETDGDEFGLRDAKDNIVDVLHDIGQSYPEPVEDE